VLHSIQDIQENEVVTLVLGIGVLLFLANQARRFGSFPRLRVFLAGFLALMAAWIFTILEGDAPGEGTPPPPLFVLFNTLEHIGYALSSVLLSVWCWLVFGARGGEVR
jgi:hypothetical protein